jgi:prepilin-type N-terminal cleavage/methylation domain-containing protein/prepilin-type processing-associated H-X9-DG protein
MKISTPPHFSLRHARSQASTGFTLVELLVVISIIAILAGFAMPAFQKVQERARATACASNLNQLGKGVRMYLTDNDDQMFPKSGAWPVLLHDKAVPDWKVFRSPFDAPSGSRPAKDTAPNAPVSYGLNEKVLGTNTSKFEAPSQLFLMAAAMDQGKIVSFSGTSESSPTITPSGGAGGKFGTHSGRSQINVLFADSHVASLNWIEYSNNSGDSGKLHWTPFE